MTVFKLKERNNFPNLKNFLKAFYEILNSDFPYLRSSVKLLASFYLEILIFHDKRMKIVPRETGK